MQISPGRARKNPIRDLQDKVGTANANTSLDSKLITDSISSLVSPPVPDTELLQQFVLQFLQHDGYVETARAFAEEMQVEKESLSLDPNTHIEGVNIKDDEDAHRRQRMFHLLISRICTLTLDRYQKGHSRG